jgi:hypothetical protein
VVKALCYKLTGSRPDEVMKFTNLPNPSGHTRTTHYFSENLVAPGIKPGPLDL